MLDENAVRAQLASRRDALAQARRDAEGEEPGDHLDDAREAVLRLSGYVDALEWVLGLQE